MKDPRDPLSNTLQTWTHEPAPDAHFNAAVWQRIQSTTTADSTSAATPAPVRRASFFARFPAVLPLAAGFAVVFAGAIGSTTALALNRAEQRDRTERLAANYARSIDPVLMTATDGIWETHQSSSAPSPATHSHP